VVLDAVERLHDRLVLGQRVAERRVARVQLQRRDRHGDQQRDRQPGRQQGATQHAVDDPRPQADARGALLQAADERHAALVDAGAELRHHRREHRQRADHRDGDDEDRPGRERGERRRAGQVHAGHGDHDGQARHEDGVPRRRGGGLQRGVRVLAGGALLTGAAQVEERVVDAHGQADEQDDVVDRLLYRRELAERADEPHRGHDGGDREEQGEAGGDQRPERDQQDDQRDGSDRLPAFARSSLKISLKLLVRARVAELLDDELGVRLLSGLGLRDRAVDDLLDARGLLVAGDDEADHGGRGRRRRCRRRPRPL
jgi:hypothetical protein